MPDDKSIDDLTTVPTPAASDSHVISQGSADFRETSQEIVDSAGALLKVLFDAESLLVAVTDDTPVALPIAASRILGRKSSGSIAALTAAELLTIINVEAAANVTDATNVDAAGGVMETDFNAQTILLAVANDTPLPLIIGASTILGRKSTGDVVALTAADLLTILGVEAGATSDQTGAEIKTAYEGEADTNEFSDAEQTKLSGVEASADVTDLTNVDTAGAVMETDYGANSILSANSANTPLSLAVAASRIVGRKSSGDVVALTADELLTILGLILNGNRAYTPVESVGVITHGFDAGDNAAGNVGAETQFRSFSVTTNASAGATLTVTNVIPGSVFMLGITARVITGFGTGSGLTSFDIGDGSDVDRWGASIAIASGTTVDYTDAVSSVPNPFNVGAALSIILTSNGGNFDGTGQIEVICHYLDLLAPTG